MLRARADADERHEYRRCDVLEPSLFVPRSRRFDLIVAFGLLHHIPSLAARSRLLGRCARALGPRGVLALSFWQFADDARFQRKIIPWADFNRTADVAIDESELEPGDFLMRWGSKPADATRESGPAPSLLSPRLERGDRTPRLLDRPAGRAPLPQRRRQRVARTSICCSSRETGETGVDRMSQRFGRFSAADLAWLTGYALLLVWLLYRNYALGETRPPTIEIGPLRLYSFGLLVALDFLFSFYLVRRWALGHGLDWPTLARGLVWIAGLGYYISHVVSLVAYYPEDLGDPIAWLDARTRISSYGGFYGGAAVALIFLRRNGLPIARYADALIYGLVGGYIFGRLGCFSVHDHPGRETDFPLAVELDGVWRHDLGLYEMLFLIGVFTLLNVVAWRRRPPGGTILGLTAVLYAPVRFGLDALRIVDVTYGGLTPAQWFCLPTLLIGVLALRRARRHAGAAAE